MYIDKWWGEMVGDTDDSLTLLDYFERLENTAMSMKQIYADLELDRALGGGTFLGSGGVCYRWKAGEREFRANFDFAINVIVCLAAILLETLVSGYVNMKQLDSFRDEKNITIRADRQDIETLRREMGKFSSSWREYDDLSGFVPGEDMERLSGICISLTEELARFCA